MKNIFEYKPQLQYVLEDINSINNIRDQEIRIEETYIRAMPSISLERVESNLLKIDRLEKEISDVLKNTSMRANENLVDESLNELIDKLTDGNKYIVDKIITYNLYKECKDNYLLDNISKEWERHHSDISGLIEAEIYPYIQDLKEDNEIIKSIIENTLTYNKVYLNNQDLREKELLEIENSIRIKNQLKKEYSQKNINMQKVRPLQKNTDLINIQMNFRTNMYETLNDLINESSDLIDIVSKEISSSTKKNLETFYSLQSNELSKTIPDDHKLKLLLYQGFKDKRDKYYSMKKEREISFGSKIKKNAEKALSVYARLFLDVAIPIVLDLNNSKVMDDLAPGLTHVFSGVEDITSKKELVMIDFKNILKASNRKTKEGLSLISEKDRARRLYNNIR